MTGPLLIYLAQWAFVLIALTVAWCLGARAERQAASLYLAAYALSVPAAFIHLDLVVAIDLVLTMGLIWLALAHRRWWLLVAAGNGLVIMIAHLAVMQNSDIWIRASISYRALPNQALVLALLLAPLERWLAGEQRAGLTGRPDPGDSRRMEPSPPRLTLALRLLAMLAEGRRINATLKSGRPITPARKH